MKRWLSTISRFSVAMGFSFATLYSALTFAAGLDIAQKPLFLATQAEPNMMILLDNSAGMRFTFGSGIFNEEASYYALFDNGKNYKYDPSIPVDTSAYSVPISSSVSGAFVESSCIPSASDRTCWSGNFLNFAATRGIDVARMVLFGGKVENRSGYDYLGLGNGAKQYKIVSDNTPEHSTLTHPSGNSLPYSPITNNSQIKLISAPHNSGRVQSTYDPYAKLVVVGGFLYDQNKSVIGEFDSPRVHHLDTYGWAHITFNHSYTTPPVVVAGPIYFEPSSR